jgi:hypothetical protein
MKTFAFENYKDFGVFIKVHQDSIRGILDVNLHEKFNIMLSIYENSKGGCGCNLNKRQEAAKNSYIEGVPTLFSDLNLASYSKQALSQSDQIQFKQDDQQFFLI